MEKWDLKLLVMTVTIMPLRMLFVCSHLCCYCVYALCVFGYLSMFSRAYTNEYVNTRY